MRRRFGPSPRPAARRARGIAAVVACGLALGGAALASDTAPSTDLPDLSAIRAKIYAGDYETAAAELLALTPTVRHADLYNLLGYSLRNLKRYDEAARWYKEALYYDPVHRPAIEYQGELFIAIGDRDKAQKNLELLRLLCHPTGCPEIEQLEKALAADAGRPAAGKPEPGGAAGPGSGS